MRTLIPLFVLCCIAYTNTQAQEYMDFIEEGKKLYTKKSYYKAFQCFHAAELNSRINNNPAINQESKDWQEKAVKGVIQQQIKTDSLLQEKQAITKQFYFYQGRITWTAGAGGYLGLINSKGETIVSPGGLTSSLENKIMVMGIINDFDEQTGYAKLFGMGDFHKFWLSTTGKRYPANIPLSNLPKVQRKNVEQNQTNNGQELEDLSQYKKANKTSHHITFNEGIDKFHQGLFYDAFVRFNEATYAQDEELVQLSEKLKKKSVTQIHLKITEAKKALKDAERVLRNFYYTYNQFALAYQDKQFYFINPEGKVFEKLGKWHKAEQFSYRTCGFAKVWKDDEEYYLDTLGNTYKVAYAAEDLDPKSKALHIPVNYELSIKPNQLSSKIFQNTQLEVLLLSQNRIIELPTEIGNLKNLTYLDLSGNGLTTLPLEIGNLHNLTKIDLQSNENLDLASLCTSFAKFPKKIFIGNHVNEYDLPAPQKDRLIIQISRLSSLPKEIGTLQNLTELQLGSNELSSLPKEIGTLQNLTELNLRSNRLSTLPVEIGNLQNLKQLDLGYNKLSTLPREIGNLQNLTELNLSSNELSTLPSEIGNLQNLTELNLSRNRLSTLPLEIGNLQNLTELNLDNNQLTGLPAEIGNLKKLRSLSLWDNPLSTFPTEIGNLKNLTELNLSIERLSILPKEIGNFKNLTGLSLSSNQLITLPIEIGNLQNLNYLDLGESEYLDIASLCVAFANFPKEISLSNSDSQSKSSEKDRLTIRVARINELPAEIGNLKNLTSLNIWNNQLKTLPAEIGNLKNLTFLYLYDNQLKTLPAEIGNLQNLTYLNLSKNQLNHLPKEMGNLENLAFLNLTENKDLDIKSLCIAFADFPKNISISEDGSSALKEDELFIKIPSIKALPAEIGKLQSLTKLDLSGSLYEMNLKYEQGNFTNLDSSSNQFGILPAEIGNLENLVELNLTRNQLNTLPIEIGNLQNLTYLNLSYNQLKNLPVELGNLVNLTYLNLKDNKDLDIKSLCIAFANFPKEIIISTYEHESIGFVEDVLFIQIPELGILLAEIGKLQSLTELGLIGNPYSTYNYEDNTSQLNAKSTQLSTLPVEIGNLKNLTKLNLSNNQLSKLPQEIGNLLNLTYLNLGANQLSTLPAEIGNLTNLLELDLKENQLSTLPQEIGNLKKLLNLNLERNPIELDAQEKIIKMLPNTDIIF